MNLSDYIICILIFLGAIIILISAKYTQKIFHLLSESKLKNNWKKLRLLMFLFAIAYIGVIVLVVLGKTEWLSLLSGGIFFMGSLFVFIVVRSGLNSFRRLKELHLNLDSQELKNEELQEFAHVISHDLKAPLRGISSLAFFIKEDIESGNKKDVDEHFSLLQDRVQHLENLIDGILDYSKIGELKMEEVDLNKLIEEEFVIYQKVSNLKYTVKQKLPTIHGDKMQLFQVFSNLISNAAKYNDKDVCEIIISCVELPMYYEIVMEDNGPGIAPKYHHKIFEIFQTLNHTYSKEGTGVGLAIVKKILEKHEGKIIVKSDGKQGTKFVITYPKPIKA